MPCSEKRANRLLQAGRARVHRRFPFVIRLVDLEQPTCALQPLHLKLDPGSKTTGLAVCRLEERHTPSSPTLHISHILFLMELVHRGAAIKAALHSRSAHRRRRRSNNLRYRQPRFFLVVSPTGQTACAAQLNRKRKAGWLTPSLQHRVNTTSTWVRRLTQWAPLTELSQELVRFDAQLMQNAEISGIEYQQGTLAGYSVREYLLEKFGRQCQYCDATDVPLQIEHVIAKARGGSNRVSNLTLACGPCNLAKNSRDIRDFLAKDPLRLARVMAQLQKPLRDAAAVNSTRNALFNALKQTGLPVSTGTGAQTKWNRTRLGIPKAHALDAACVGQTDAITGTTLPVLIVKCTGRGSHSRTLLDRYGFPRAQLSRKKTAFGFRTGDMVKATVLKGKKAGTYVGRVAIRQTGSFNIQAGKPGEPVVQGISHKHCTLLQRGDGYSYTKQQSSKRKEVG